MHRGMPSGNPPTASGFERQGAEVGTRIASLMGDSASDSPAMAAMEQVRGGKSSRPAMDDRCGGVSTRRCLWNREVALSLVRRRSRPDIPRSPCLPSHKLPRPLSQVAGGRPCCFFRSLALKLAAVAGWPDRTVSGDVFGDLRPSTPVSRAGKGDVRQGHRPRHRSRVRAAGRPPRCRGRLRPAARRTPPPRHGASR